MLGRDRPDMSDRRHNKSTINDCRNALVIERRDQNFADAEFGDDRFGVEFWICAERRRGGLDALLLLWRVCTKRVLDAIAELRENLLRNVRRILRDKLNAHALRANETDDLLDLVNECLRSVAKQQVSFVKKEYELWLVEIAGLGQRLE